MCYPLLPLILAFFGRNHQLHGLDGYLAMNMYCLYQVRAAERLFGSFAFVVIYLVAGLAGALLSLTRPDPAVSVGASGALFGIFGAFFAVLIKNRARFERDAFMGQMRSLGGFLVINLAIGLAVPMIDMRAHIGGLVGGAIAGLAVAGGRPGRARTVRIAGVALAALVATATLVSAMPAPIDTQSEVSDVLSGYQRIEADFAARWARYESGAVDANETRRALEHDIVAPWRDLRARLVAIERLPGGLEKSRSAIVGYFDARLALWEHLASIVGHESDPMYAAEVRRADTLVTAWQAADRALRDAFEVKSRDAP